MERALRFSVSVDGVVVVGCEVVVVGLLDFRVMVLELDSSFGWCFCMELGGVKELTSNGMVSMIYLFIYLLTLFNVGLQNS